MTYNIIKLIEERKSTTKFTRKSRTQKKHGLTTNKLEKKPDIFYLHKAIKGILGKRKQQHHEIIKNKNRKPITGIGVQLGRWKKCLSKKKTT